MNACRYTFRCFLLLLSIAIPFQAHPVIAEGISYQAYLSNSDGTPVTATVSITFSAFNVDIGGSPLWSDTQSITPDQGLLNARLGTPVNPLPANLFNGPVYIGLFVAGEELLPRRELLSVGYSYKSADADTLTGFSSADLDQSAEVTANSSAISDNAGLISNNSSAIASNTADIGANASGIAGNEFEIGSLENRIEDNEVDIGQLQSIGADITSVVPGQGLGGGGFVGDATLFIKTGGVTSSMIADDAVGATQIDSSGSFNMRKLVVGNGSLGSELWVYAPQQPGKSMRFFDSTGFTEFANIEVNPNYVWIQDEARNRTMLDSDSTGLSLGTITKTPDYAVTVPSLSVLGQTDIGLEIVAQNYSLTPLPSCNVFSNSNCGSTFATVACPVGKKAISGGLNAGAADTNVIGSSSPFSNGWQCASASQLITTHICYAVCARVE